MADNSANLSLPYIMPNQAQKHVTHNEAIRILDALVQLCVLSRSGSVPPEEPADGERHIVATGGEGAWAGWDGSVACFVDGAWARLVPQAGWLAWVRDEEGLLVWTGSAWIPAGAATGGAGPVSEVQNAVRIGLGTQADAANPFSARLNRALWAALAAEEGGTGSIVSAFSKAAEGGDAGFALQDGYSTRALLGLFGSDDFVIRVSPDGNTFYQGLAIDRASGNVAIGADPDANNRLLVSGGSALFTNAASLNVAMSKGAVGDDLAFALQSGFATQALLGLLANNDFTIKVGAEYTPALVIDNATGTVSHPQNAKFSAYASSDQLVPADSWVRAEYDQLRHNVGGHYDTATSTFTAPADGIYLFEANALYRSAGAAPSLLQLGFTVDGGTSYKDRRTRFPGSQLVDNETMVSVISQIELLAGETVSVEVRYSSQAGVLAGGNVTHFWGMQVA